MFRNIVISAFGAGLAACVVVSALQAFTTEPLILHAETFENAGEATPHAHDAVAAAGAALPTASAEAAIPAHVHDEEEWAPAAGLERTAYTLLANFLVGVAVSLMLLGGMALKGGPIDARQGLLWGLAGFAAASLLPGLGLPPELPGTPAAEIVSRQTWWVGTAVASAVAIYALVYGASWLWRTGGLILLVLPHVVGAPPPPSLEADYPAVLAGEFVIASVVVSGVLWAVSGLAAGWLHQRLSQTA